MLPEKYITNVLPKAAISTEWNLYATKTGPVVRIRVGRTVVRVEVEQSVVRVRIPVATAVQDALNRNRIHRWHIPVYLYLYVPFIAFSIGRGGESSPCNPSRKSPTLRLAPYKKDGTRSTNTSWTNCGPRRSRTTRSARSNPSSHRSSGRRCHC